MQRNRIVEGIREVAKEHLDWQGELPLNARLIEDLELDSIRLMTLAVEVENRFRVAIDPQDEEQIATVEDLVVAVERLLQGELE